MILWARMFLLDILDIAPTAGSFLSFLQDMEALLLLQNPHNGHQLYIRLCETHLESLFLWSHLLQLSYHQQVRYSCGHLYSFGTILSDIFCTSWMLRLQHIFQECTLCILRTSYLRLSILWDNFCRLSGQLNSEINPCCNRHTNLLHLDRTFLEST